MRRRPSRQDALAALADHLDEAVIATHGSEVVTLNRTAEQLLGVSRERAAGRPLIEVVLNHRVEALAREGGQGETELAGRWVRVRAVPGGIVIQDLTATRRRERELRETAGVLSHEFRTPVAAIAGLLEALEHDLPPEQRGSFARMAAAEAARLTRLVDDLTVGFRPTAERTFPIGEALERARAVLDRLYPGDAHRLSSEGRHLLVRGDPDRVLQVVLNLVENALKYGPEDGSIRVCAEQDGTLVRVTVRDEGAPLDDYEVLFEAHRRAGRSGPGSGLGLYVVRQIVRDWGGTVWGRHSYDEPRGNEFGFSIPAAASASGGPVQGGNDARGA